MLINSRLLIGIGLSLVVGFLFDTQYEINKILSQRDLIKELTLKIKNNDSLLVEQGVIEKKSLLLHNTLKQYPAYDLLSVLFYFYQKAWLSGLSVQLIKPYPVKHPDNNDSEVVKIWAVGKLYQFDAFFYALEQAHFPIQLGNFSMHYLNNDNWRVLLYFNVFSSETSSLFCQQIIKDHFSSDELLALFPLNQIRYVGLIDSNGLRWAIVKLPNERTLSIQLGSMVGIERASVVEITEQKISFLDQQKQVFNIIPQKGIK